MWYTWLIADVCLWRRWLFPSSAWGSLDYAGHLSTDCKGRTGCSAQVQAPHCRYLYLVRWILLIISKDISQNLISSLSKEIQNYMSYKTPKESHKPLMKIVCLMKSKSQSSAFSLRRNVTYLSAWMLPTGMTLIILHSLKLDKLHSKVTFFFPSPPQLFRTG